jgi:pyrroloquinoline quinone (PQQ) biosynthesis protein C
MYHSLHRRFYFRMMGAIGAGESTFPYFCQNVVAGITRNGIQDRDALAYHARHATLDTEHGHHWLTRVLLPLRNSFARDASREILLGLTLQLTVTSEYYDALYEHWLRAPGSPKS